MITKDRGQLRELSCSICTPNMMRPADKPRVFRSSRKTKPAERRRAKQASTSLLPLPGAVLRPLRASGLYRTPLANAPHAELLPQFGGKTGWTAIWRLRRQRYPSPEGRGLLRFLAMRPCYTANPAAERLGHRVVLAILSAN